MRIMDAMIIKMLPDLFLKLSAEHSTGRAHLTATVIRTSTPG